MKKIVCTILAFLLASNGAIPALAGGESHVYDAQGRYQGRATVNPANPKQTNLYDAKGRYVGRVMTGPDGEARFYDRQGGYIFNSIGHRNQSLEKNAH